jgi:hypothetical protein
VYRLVGHSARRVAACDELTIIELGLVFAAGVCLSGLEMRATAWKSGVVAGTGACHRVIFVCRPVECMLQMNVCHFRWTSCCCWLVCYKSFRLRECSRCRTKSCETSLFLLHTRTSPVTAFTSTTQDSEQQHKSDTQQGTSATLFAAQLHP